MRAGGPSRYGGGGGSGGGYSRGDFDDAGLSVSPSIRRPGTPVQISYAAPEDESQDEARYAPGSRVKHAKFGSGTIAEVTGSGREAKVKIDFDDEAIGRKTLVVAVARLARGDD
jgi:DNA helicase-2/ATP-dependent DNA helicase PcrA